MANLTYTYSAKVYNQVQRIHVEVKNVTRDKLEWIGTDDMEAWLEIDGRILYNVTDLCYQSGILHKVLEEADWEMMYAEAMADQLETKNQI